MAYICYDGLRAAGVNIVGVVGPKKSHETYANFKTFLAIRGMDLIDYDSLDDASFLQKLRNLHADVAVVCSFNEKIPNLMLDTVKDGFLNVHPSLLPMYRGGNPYSAVIINGERLTGVSIHYMTEDFDKGDLVAQKQLEIGQKETMGTLFNRLNMLSVEMIKEVLKDYELKTLVRISQPEGEFPKAPNFNDFSIDWHKSAPQIEAFIRSLNPFFSASCVFRKTFVKILSADFKAGKPRTSAGTIEKIDKHSIQIATQDGYLIPKVMQFGSFFIGTSEDFIRFLAPKQGEVFE